MQENFYLDLSDEVIATCEELLHLAEEWYLPIKQKENFVGFGKIHGFYMFWIARKDGVDYFKARVGYAREQLRDVVYYPLTAENKDAILGAAEAIYREFLAHGSELELPKKPRIKPADLWGRGQSSDYKSPWHEVARRAVSKWKETAGEGEPSIPGEELFQAAHAFSHTVDRLLLLLSNEIRVIRTKDVWKRYVLTDAETLERISVDYSLTRERIRQLVRKGNREIAALFARYCTYEKNEEYDACVLKMLQALENAPCTLPVFLQNAFCDWGERKRKSALQILFGEENGAELFEACAKYQKTVTKAVKKQEGDGEKLTRLQEMIQYPTEVHADTEEQIGVFPKEREYTYVASFRKRLEKLHEHLRFVQNPNIVYYSSSKTDHRPDFLLEFENGRRVLVLVLPVFNMAYAHNRTRFRALHAFCEKKGYGYLVVDDRSQTLWGLKQLTLEEALVRALDEILLKNGRILWADISELKKNYTVTNAMIAAYVLQNNLYFSMDPNVYICRFS